MTSFAKFMSVNGLKRKDIATFLGVSGAFITQISSGDRPLPDEKLAMIEANAYGWDVSMLRNDGIIADHISGGNQIMNQRNSGSTINQNAITIELPERGSKKIINPDGSVRVESENCPDEALTEYLRGEISRLQQKVEELTESNMELRSENAVLKYQIMMLNK